jgi:hypothetical protein
LSRLALERSRDNDVRRFARAWADRILPTLRHHHQMARDLEREERREASR